MNDANAPHGLPPEQPVGEPASAPAPAGHSADQIAEQLAHPPGGPNLAPDGTFDVLGDTTLPGTDERSFGVGLVIVVFALFSGLATYLILNGLTPIVPSNEVVTRVLLVNLLLILAMIASMSVQVQGLAKAWRDRVPGARLHARIVVMFCLISALPALLIALGATITFSRTLDGIFNRETRTIVENSLDVANAYLEEHGAVIRTDIVNMAKDVDDAATRVKIGDKAFLDLLFAQAGLRDLPVAYVVDAEGKIKAAALENENIPYIAPPADMIQVTETGQVPLLMPVNSNRVAALAKLNNFPGSYLYVARGVNPKVLGHLRRTQAGVALYDQLRRARGNHQWAYGIMYFMMSMTALLAAIWSGFWFAGRFVTPIRRLIGAAQTVSRGNLKVKLPIYKGEGDLRRLSQNFNHMTGQLDRQRTDLMTANSQLVERRRFMEAVLSGVSAGVVGLDPDGTITLANRSAEKLLGREVAELTGRNLAEAIPEFAFLIHQSDEAQRKKPQHEVTLQVGGQERTFSARLTRETQGEEDYGAVLTFDDVTELVSAQRTSAWADIARRIAHEIKNPLTPIQLSAERLRRKYSQIVIDDREVFDKCTETIIRQVGDVARMVDEFSSFARMPKADMANLDARDAVRDSVTLFQMASGGIDIILNMPKEPLMVSADRRLLSQALTNLVKNGSESVQSVIDGKDKPEGFKGRVETHVRRDGHSIVIEVIDNGTGLPKQGRSRLLEPYVTTKGTKGTGLGLAIVQKIVEQHNGSLVLEDAPVAPGRERGALVRITLPALDLSVLPEQKRPLIGASRDALAGAAS
jgi:two-component system, NtrC family, nitrogen regulation sensor histidine kinase NtrY